MAPKFAADYSSVHHEHHFKHIVLVPWVVVRRVVHEEAPQRGPGQSGGAKGVEDVLPARGLGDDPAQHQGQCAASRHPWKRGKEIYENDLQSDNSDWLQTPVDSLSSDGPGS